MTKNTSDLLRNIDLGTLYGNVESVIKHQELRYQKLLSEFKQYFKTEPEAVFSTPGRTELSGNHTDHNHGLVIAAAINLDSIAVVSKNDEKITVYSDGYDEPFELTIRELNFNKNEKGTTTALIRGIARKLSDEGYKIGGFNACITSDVLQGSGLSSSASIEVLIGTIFNCLYNDGKIDSTSIARIGQHAENNFFGKPCGLMDQIACSTGGIVGIDFEDSGKPKITTVDFDLHSLDYTLVVLHTGGSHINLTNDYASVPGEMFSVASFFGKKTLREVEYDEFVNHISALRGKVSDRAVLRALHFFNENIRVKEQMEALKKNDFESFLRLVQQSGDSSFKYLQNIYSASDVSYQPVSVGLALTEQFIRNTGRGACRVHGGGFAGTIQVFIPKDTVPAYKTYLRGIFEERSVQTLSIRSKGTVCLYIAG